jgi:hypothetical protein
VKAFLSYPREREAEAETAYRFLQAVGLDTWWDRTNLVPGDDWNRERAAAQATADLFVLICAPETFAKTGVIQREVRQALEVAKDRPPGQNYILSLRTEDIPLPSELGQFHWLDMFSDGWRPLLARALKKAFEQRSQPIPPALEVALATSTSSAAEPMSIEEEDVNGTRSVFFLRYPATETYWEYVNAEINARALGSLYEARRHQADWTHGTGTGDWEMSVSEFHRSGDLVSLVVAGSSYLNGAIHPNHFVNTLNLFGPTVGKADIHDLFDNDTKAFDLILEYCDLDLKRQSVAADEAPITLESFLGQDRWDIFRHYNVNDRGMILNFSAAAGLPHVLGVFDIYIPWEWVKDFLSPTIRAFLRSCGVPIEPPPE